MSDKWKVIFKELKNEDFSNLDKLVSVAKEHGMSDEEIHSDIVEFANSNYSILTEIRSDYYVNKGTKKEERKEDVVFPMVSPGGAIAEAFDAEDLKKNS